MGEAPFDAAVLVVTVWIDVDERVRARLLFRGHEGGESESLGALGLDAVVDAVRTWLEEAVADLR